MGCGNLEAYVVTTKQTRFVEALLQARGAWTTARPLTQQQLPSRTPTHTHTDSPTRWSTPHAPPGIALPRERIFGLGSGPKADVLARLARLAREQASNDESMDREPVVRACMCMGKPPPLPRIRVHRWWWEEEKEE